MQLYMLCLLSSMDFYFRSKGSKSIDSINSQNILFVWILVLVQIRSNLVVELFGVLGHLVFAGLLTIVEEMMQNISLWPHTILFCPYVQPVDIFPSCDTVCVYIFVCMCVCMYLCMYVCIMYIGTYVWMYECVYAC